MNPIAVSCLMNCSRLSGLTGMPKRSAAVNTSA